MCRFIKIVLKLPAILTLLFLIAMPLIDSICVACHINNLVSTTIATLVFAFSASIIAYACFLFWQARTTANPITPENASKLVTTGIYSLTRNPMYLGFLSILIAAAFLYSNPINFLLLPLFIMLVNKLYITQEEKALEKIFGDQFIAYKSKVRRWV